MEREPLFVLRSRSLRYTGVEITPGEPEVVIPRGVTVVTGPNGAGKSTLARIIERGRNFLTNKIDCTIASPRVTVMEFGDIHSLSGFKAGYYQQRYEATMNDEVPSVGELLASRTGSGRWRRLVALFGLGGVEEKKVNFLSSGELRKLLVANALVDAPDLLVLDNPYIGLDPAGRAAVDSALAVLAAEGTTSLMLLLPDPDDIPCYADCVLVMDRCHLLPAGTDPAPLFNFSLDTTKLPEPAEGPHEGRSEVFSFADCPVTSADRLLIPSVTWTVCQGGSPAQTARASRPF